MKKGLVAFALMLIFAGVVMASSDPAAKLENAIDQLCGTAIAILGAAVMLLVVLAAVVYGIGQVMGAETRARASVWATSMIIGAVIALIIYVVLPTVLATLMGENIECGTGGAVVRGTTGTSP